VGLTKLGAIPCAGLMPALFGVVGQVSAQLSAQLTGLFGMELTVNLGFPDLLGDLALVAEANVAFGIALAFTPPYLNAELSLGLVIQLGIVESLIVALEALVGLDGELACYTYQGSSLGGDLASYLMSGWNDGTPPTTEVTALILVAQGGPQTLVELFSGLPFGPGIISQGGIRLSAALGSTFSFLQSLLATEQSDAQALAAGIAGATLLPPDVAGSLQDVASIDASLQAALSAVPPIPTVGATALLEIQAQITAIGALVAQIETLLSLGELDVFTYVGAGADLGGALAGQVTGPCAAVILGATTQAGSTALEFFGGA
jgi:hypothetical protein